MTKCSFTSGTPKSLMKKTLLGDVGKWSTTKHLIVFIRRGCWKSTATSSSVVVWVIVRVCSVVLRRTVVVVDRRFDNLSGSHHQSKRLLSLSLVYIPLTRRQSRIYQSQSVFSSAKCRMPYCMVSRSIPGGRVSNFFFLFFFFFHEVNIFFPRFSIISKSNDISTESGKVTTCHHSVTGL